MPKQKYIAFPEEYTRRQLNALYREIPLKDTKSRLLRKYFNAMATLYGVLPLGKAKEIIFSLDPKLVTEEEFMAFVEIARHECEGYYILRGEELYSDVEHSEPMEWEVVDIDLVTAQEDIFPETKEIQADKPYYVPEKKQFLEYADPFYCEDTPEKLQLSSFLKMRCGLTEHQANYVMDSFVADIRTVSFRVAKAYDRLDALGIRLKTERDADRFFELFTAFHNATRLPCNRGYTPAEIWESMPPEERVVRSLTLGPNIQKALRNGDMDIDDFRKSLLTADISDDFRRAYLKALDDFQQQEAAKPAKVSRNAPCPCGSGKKYKNCCGKGKIS